MLNVIAVDDNPVVVDTLKEVVPWEELGFNLVSVFTDSRKALDYVNQNHVDIIISDIAMAEPNGLEIVKICESSYPHIKIILLSAFRNFEYAREAIRYRNVLEYLTKPLDFGVLCEILKNLSAERKSQPVKNEFSSEASLDERLEFFSNLMCEYTVTDEEITQSLHKLNIKANPHTTACTIVSFHIDEFDSYIENTWKYSSLQLYYAISNAFPPENDEAYFSLANYAYANITWIIIHKNSESISQTVESFKERLISNLKDFLKMNLSINFHKTYRSLCEFVTSSTLAHPDVPNSDQTIAGALSYMQENYHKDLSMKEVADVVFMSPSYFSTYFKRATNEKFIDMLTKIRIENAAKFLKQDDLKVNEICEMVGYSHMGNFYEKFKKIYGMTPAEYKNKFGGN